MNEKNSILSNNPVILDSIIEYQTGSIVSKTLVDTDKGTVTLFAFASGQNLSEHTAPYDALVYIVDGEAIITIGEKTHIVKKNEIILLPANIPHSVKAIKKFKMLLTMIRANKISKKGGD